MQVRNTIQSEDKSKPTGFSPKQRNMQNGDSIIFFNEDRKTSHQPYPTGGDKNAWGGEIQPQASSDTIDLNSVGVFAYACAIHPEETGSITVASQVQIGASPQGGCAFAPTPNAVVQGQTVSWLNSTAEAHQPAPVDGADNAWTEPIEPESEACTPVPFGSVGTFPYRCALHPEETGSILVGNVTFSNPTGAATATISPSNLKLSASSPSLVFLNNDATNHQPVPDAGSPWLSGPVVPNAVTDVIKLPQGTFSYKCILHPTETGTITVTE